MRPIRQLETEEQAQTSADYLFIRDIETQVEPGIRLAACHMRGWPDLGDCD